MSLIDLIGGALDLIIGIGGLPGPRDGPPRNRLPVGIVLVFALLSVLLGGVSTILLPLPSSDLSEKAVKEGLLFGGMLIILSVVIGLVCKRVVRLAWDQCLTYGFICAVVFSFMRLISNFSGTPAAHLWSSPSQIARSQFTATSEESTA